MTPPTEGDTALEGLMAGLASCLCGVLTEARRPACCCMWFEGDHRPPMDNCHCDCPDGPGAPTGQGVAWVREVQRDNIANPGQPRRTFGGECAVPPSRVRLTIELGIYRCVPTGDPETGPTCQERTNAAADGAWDAALLEYAVACCDALDGRQVQVLNGGPIGPVGGCGGRFLVLTANRHAPKDQRPKGGGGAPSFEAPSKPSTKRL
ncbi:hypothetical protein [Streptomyces sp. NPDC088739]|uniref:hypothetical protein n=1 Tax=Streptomyces sp. NPDC088739 TaxID=3365882 RepID=UPI0037F89058